MDETAQLCIEGETVLVSERHIKLLDQKTQTLKVPAYNSSNSNNALSAPQQKMQGQVSTVSPAYQTLALAAGATSILQSLNQALVVKNPSGIASDAIATQTCASEKEKPELTSSQLIQVNPADVPNTDTKLTSIKNTVYHIRLQTVNGICAQINISSPGVLSSSIDINSIVKEAVAQVYNFGVDLEALVMDEELSQETIIMSSTEEEEEGSVIGPLLSDDSVPQVCEEQVVEEEVIEETIIESSQSDIVDQNVVVCRNCMYASPDPLICQRCRRPLDSAVSTPLPPPPSPPVISSPVVTPPTRSPQKHEKADHHHRHRHNKSSSHHYSSKDRKHHGTKRCKREERRREEAKKLDDTTVSLLSSDEEEEVKGVENGRKPKTDVFLKEPIITPDTEPMVDSLRGGGLEIESLLDNPDIEKIRLDCRSVRFGSYKVQPLDTIVLTEHGVKLKVPSLSKSSTIIKILMKDIVKVLIHFGKSGQFYSMAAPTFFYYITHEASKRIRDSLHMTAKNKEIFFDPTSKEESHKRITLLPETVTVADRLFIKSIYETRCLMEELTWDEANDILVRAAPKEVQHNLKKEGAPSVKHLPTPPNSSENIQQIMIYPPPPFKGGISINTEDYGCLKEDQFLNDVIIDFYLKYLWLNVFTDEQKRRTHIFSSFFYKRLTMMSPRQNHSAKDNLTPAEKRHARVKGWTKSVDIFDKDFIIIPINEKSHWFLGIICFPGLNGPVRMADNTPVPDTTRRKGKDDNVLSGGQIPAKIWGTTISIVKGSQGSDRSSTPSSQQTIKLEPDDGGNGSERDEAEADDDEMEPNTTDEEETPKEDELLDEATPPVSKVKPIREAIKQPCILIFDSLMEGQSRAKVVATLREYLQVEWKVRHKGKPKDFSKDTFKGAVPKVPQQPNFVDCGLYLLQFVEAFFKNPITDYRMPIRSINEWFTKDVVARKRYDIMKLLHELMKEQKIDTSQLNLPHLDLELFTDYEDHDDEEGDSMEYQEEEYMERGVCSGLGERADGMMDFGEDEMMGEEEEEALPEEEEEEMEEEMAGLGGAGVKKPSDPPLPSAREHQNMAKGKKFVSQRVEGRVRAVEMTRLEVRGHQNQQGGRGGEKTPSRRFEVPSQRLDASSPAPHRLEAAATPATTPTSHRLEAAAAPATPSSRLDRGDVSIQPRSQDSRASDSSSQSRPRLPDSVTICEANSKRKLPLSLKDIRVTRLSSPQQNATIEKVKKPRVE